MKVECTVEVLNGIMVITEISTQKLIGKIRLEHENTNLTKMLGISTLHPNLFDTDKKVVMKDLRFEMRGTSGPTLESSILTQED